MDGAAQAAVGAGDAVFLADESATVMNNQKTLRSFGAGLHGYLQSGPSSDQRHRPNVIAGSIRLIAGRTVRNITCANDTIGEENKLFAVETSVPT